MLSDNRGFSVLESMLVVALLGLVGPAFFLAFSSSTRAIQITGDQIQAEALARTQLEAIMNSPYASSYSLIEMDPGFRTGS